MKILVTGGAGFIGSWLVQALQDQAEEIRVLDNLRSGKRQNLEGLRHTFLHGSVTDRGAVRDAVAGVDYIFHLAAMISVPESMENPVECVELNATGTLIVLEEAARAGAKKLVLSSSAAIYGDNPVVPKSEDMVPEPKSPYAVTKLDGEYYCQMFAREGRLATACLRYFNVFGPRQDPASAYAAAIPAFISRAVAGQPLIIYGDGGQTRDFVSVRDVARANIFAATSDAMSGVYNVGYGRSISINDLARQIVEMAGSSSEIRHEPPRAGDVKHSLASADRLREAGCELEADFRGALKQTVAFFAGQ